MKQYVEIFNNVKIRMLQDEDGTVWAVLRDIMEGLGRNNNNEIDRSKKYVDELYDETGVKSCEVKNFNTTSSKARKTQEQLCIIEEAIYNVIAINIFSKNFYPKFSLFYRHFFF